MCCIRDEGLIRENIDREFSRYTHTWKKYFEKETLNRPSAEQIRKYYGGFNKINRSPMYKDELDDLEQVYESALDELEQDTERRLPILVYEMKNFLSLYVKTEDITEKLENLRAKRDSQGAQ